MVSTNEKNKITELLDRNQITLKNLYDIEQDMGKLLDFNSTINYHNCQNLIINIGSKINRISFHQCNNIQVKLNGLISGIEVKNCHEISIENGIKKHVNCVMVEKSSNIKLILSKKIHRGTLYQIDKEKNINIQDHHGKKLIFKKK